MGRYHCPELFWLRNSLLDLEDHKLSPNKQMNRHFCQRRESNRNYQRHWAHHRNYNSVHARHHQLKALQIQVIFLCDIKFRSFDHEFIIATDRPWPLIGVLLISFLRTRGYWHVPRSTIPVRSSYWYLNHGLSFWNSIKAIVVQSHIHGFPDIVTCPKYGQD